MEYRPPSGGFIEQTLQRTPFTLEDVLDRIDRLSQEHLEFLLLMGTKFAQSRGDSVNVENRTLEVAIGILRYFLGPEWVHEHISADLAEVAPLNLDGRAFLNIDASDIVGRMKFRHRAVDLAACLYNCQDVPGFKQRLQLVKSGGLEATAGELDCAKAIAAPPFKLRFVVPTGTKGADYDAQFSTPTGCTVCCEIKTKLVDTECTVATVKNTLETARKQLPKHSPGVVFLKIPDAWTSRNENWHIIHEAIANIFRQSARLVAVVLTWERWKSHGTTYSITIRYAPICNILSPRFSIDIAGTLKSLHLINNSNWISLPELVANRHETIGEYARTNMRGKLSSEQSAA